MANSYTAVPSIIPGNLTVGGKLIVNGPSIQLGQNQRKYRIQELANGDFYESVNIDKIAVAQDDPTANSGARRFNGPAIQHEVHYQAAGTPASDGFVAHLYQNSAYIFSNLNVQAGQFILGANPRKYRIQEAANGDFYETINLDTIAVAQDDVTSQSQRRRASASLGQYLKIEQENAGAPNTHQQYLLLTNAVLITPDELRIGTGLPYARIAKNAGNIGLFSINLGKDLATRDDASKQAFALVHDAATPKLYQHILNAAGGVQDCALVLPLWTDYTAHVITGVTGVQTVISKTLRGNIMGANGGLLVRIRGQFNTVASGGEIITFQLNGLVLGTCQPPANTVSSFILDVLIGNQNAANSQRAMYSSQYSNILQNTTTATQAVDTTVDQTMSVNVQPTLAGDSCTINSVEVHLLNSFGPV